MPATPSWFARRRRSSTCCARSLAWCVCGRLTHCTPPNQCPDRHSGANPVDALRSPRPTSPACHQRCGRAIPARHRLAIRAALNKRRQQPESLEVNVGRITNAVALSAAACLLAACGGGTESPEATSALESRQSALAATSAVGSKYRVPAAGTTSQRSRLDARLRGARGPVEVWVSLETASGAGQRAALAEACGPGGPPAMPRPKRHRSCGRALPSIASVCARRKATFRSAWQRSAAVNSLAYRCAQRGGGAHRRVAAVAGGRHARRGQGAAGAALRDRAFGNRALRRRRGRAE